VDGGSQIGMGHIARCVRLAEYLHDKYPCDIRFLTFTPKYFDNFQKQISKFGGIVGFTYGDNDKLFGYIHETNPDILITDAQLGSRIDEYIRIAENLRYHITLVESHFNHFTFGLVVFPSMMHVTPKCTCGSKAEYLIGAKYLLIDPSLSKIQKPDFAGKTKTEILVTPGGADPSNVTEKVIEHIKTNDNPNLKFRIVLGPAKPNKDAIKQSAENSDAITFLDSPENLTEILMSSDIVITSGGTTAYESIAASRPTWVIPQIEFEKAVADRLFSKGAILGVGLDDLQFELFYKLRDIIQNPTRFDPVIEIGKKLIDAQGIPRLTDRIVIALDSMPA
jgi:UDP-2,4-diacetamido-2,4,6-trideoxy-beta-L-altropyranose hydrolase